MYSVFRLYVFKVLTELTVWHNVDLPAEICDGPCEVMVDVILLVPVAPARCLNGGLLGRIFPLTVLSSCSSTDLTPPGPFPLGNSEDR